MSLPRTLLTAAALLAGLGAARLAPAQSRPDWDPQRSRASRPDLQDLLTRLNDAAGSRAYSPALQQRARYEAAIVRERLEAGDFQPGDQIQVTLQGKPELSDSVSVTAKREIVLPTIGNIPLVGVLRSELESYLQTYLSRTVREPVVIASSPIRVLLSGAVGNPGFYSVAAATPLSDLLMTAGGINGSGELKGIRIERKQQRLLQGPALEAAVAEGQTVDDLNLRTGDRIVVPDPQTRSIAGLTWLTSIPTLLILLTSVRRVF